jgi:hypothetical protein
MTIDPIELGAPVHQLADFSRCFVRENLDRGLIAESGTCCKRIVEMKIRGVGISDCGGYAALGILGIGFR